MSEFQIVLDDALVQARQDNGIHHKRPKRLHQIQGEIGLALAVGMQIADVGIEAYHVTGRMEVVVQQRIAEAQQRVGGVSGGPTNPPREAEVLFDQVSEHREIGG